MDKRLNLLSKMLPIIDEYCASSSEVNEIGLANFIKTRKEKPLEHENSSESAIGLMQKYDDLHANISFHLSRLGKYAKYYIKAAMQNADLKTGEEFGYLATALEFDGISKTKLISYNVSEVPHGMDIIKRLVDRGFFLERVSKADRRVKLINVTDLGKAAFFSATTQMKKVGSIVVGELKQEEKQVLRALLSKLDHFHQDIYNKHKAYDVDTILAEMN